MSANKYRAHPSKPYAEPAFYKHPPASSLPIPKIKGCSSSDASVSTQLTVRIHQIHRSCKAGFIRIRQVQQRKPITHQGGYRSSSGARNRTEPGIRKPRPPTKSTIWHRRYRERDNWDVHPRGIPGDYWHTRPQVHHSRQCASLSKEKAAGEAACGREFGAVRAKY